ncbi:polysaccharide biosynthesis/export family protein [Aliiglaciecola lipolytica]|uniref:Uncharacterized protein n=1 Tax=Aliiglaciecola lipolytica E3 TaxID=1127673 RepID=K6YQW5_9ALTE|nr:polysaccharide biosynthesis/export family protein [Aliiglaciecola lipolytica]GAC13710.1 hypothetical protein GLIP_1068 [Aliiglaciecola lipolytica E3]
MKLDSLIQRPILWCLFLSVLVLALTGCTSRTPLPMASAEKLENVKPQRGEPLLSSGDVIAVGFLEATSLIDSPYQISPGDILRVDVMDHPSLTKERAVVLPDGHVSIPLVGRLLAAGKGVDELSQVLTTELTKRKIKQPSVVISVEQSQDPLDPLLRLVSRNGQYEPMRFIVGHSESIDLPFIDQVSVKTTLSELRLTIKQKYQQKFGSRLYVMVRLVDTAPPVVYVIGEVNRPGPVPFSAPYSPLMAVASAGGFMDTAESADIRLFRRQEDNSFQNWSIDLLGRLEHGMSESDQFELMPSDVIYVPKTGIAEANQAVEQYIRKMIPLQFGIGFSYSINDGTN